MAQKTTEEICQFLYQSSQNVWRRIRFARKAVLRISETTITENLLFSFWYEAMYKGLRIYLYEAIDEKTNGNDIEIFVRTTQGFILIVCQCKIVDKKYKYAFTKHKVGLVYQIELLIDYAKRFGGVPAYMFYNYMPYLIQREEFQSVDDQEKYGISILPARELLKYGKYHDADKKKPIPSFNTFHPHNASPIHEFICPILNDQISLQNFVSENDKGNIKYYTEEEIGDEKHWRSIMGEAIGFITNDRAEMKSESKTIDKRFKPKYRIVVNRSLSTMEKIEEIRKRHIPWGFAGI